MKRVAVRDGYFVEVNEVDPGVLKKRSPITHRVVLLSTNPQMDERESIADVEVTWAKTCPFRTSEDKCRRAVPRSRNRWVRGWGDGAEVVWRMRVETTIVRSDTKRSGTFPITTNVMVISTPWSGDVELKVAK